MNWQFLSKIWRPDTYFLNGKDSYLHKIAVPNRSAMTTIQSRRLFKKFSFVLLSTAVSLDFLFKIEKV